LYAKNNIIDHEPELKKMKIFNKMRMSSIVSKSFVTYFKYGIGEILLVVIGILIALQINNWNDNRKETNKLTSYFAKINNEIKSTTNIIDGNRDFTKDSMIPILRKGLRIMSEKKIDSIDGFKKALNYLTESESLTFYFPIIDEFINQGYLSKIEDSDLNGHFEHLEYIRSQCTVSDEITRNYQYRLIKPYIQKNINYSEITLFQESVEKGGQKTNYLVLYDDLELWNLLTFQLENLENSVRNFTSLSITLKQIDKKITELDTNYE
jgi:hypothetical protein